jgi:hypothetical protein
MLKAPITPNMIQSLLETRHFSVQRKSFQLRDAPRMLHRKRHGRRLSTPPIDACKGRLHERNPTESSNVMPFPSPAWLLPSLF